MIALPNPEGLTPLKIGGFLWPRVSFYDKQREIIESVRCNRITVVRAGHELGKDFVAGFLTLGAFLAPNVFLRHPDDGWLATNEVRIITTSVKDDHLRILWGELGRFIRTSSIPMLTNQRPPGNLIWNHHDIRKVNADGEKDEISYLRGMVSQKGEGMAGHHAAHTFLIIDEGSGAEDEVFSRGETWAKRILIIGNPYPTRNFFYRLSRAGDREFTGPSKERTI